MYIIKMDALLSDTCVSYNVNQVLSIIDSEYEFLLEHFREKKNFRLSLFFHIVVFQVIYDEAHLKIIQKITDSLINSKNYHPFTREIYCARRYDGVKFNITNYDQFIDTYFNEEDFFIFKFIAANDDKYIIYTHLIKNCEYYEKTVSSLFQLGEYDFLENCYINGIVDAHSLLKCREMVISTKLILCDNIINLFSSDGYKFSHVRETIKSEKILRKVYTEKLFKPLPIDFMETYNILDGDLTKFDDIVRDAKLQGHYFSKRILIESRKLKHHADFIDYLITNFSDIIFLIQIHNGVDIETTSLYFRNHYTRFSFVEHSMFSYYCSNVKYDVIFAFFSEFKNKIMLGSNIFYLDDTSIFEIFTPIKTKYIREEDIYHKVMEIINFVDHVGDFRLKISLSVIAACKWKSVIDLIESRGDIIETSLYDGCYYGKEYYNINGKIYVAS